MPSSSSRTHMGSSSFQPTASNFYCHTCGRHTSHTARPDNPSTSPITTKTRSKSKNNVTSNPSSSSTTSSDPSSLKPKQPDPPKYCSQRCRAEPRPSPIIGLVWLYMLGDPPRNNRNGRNKSKGQSPSSDGSAKMTIGLPAGGSGKDGKVLLCSDVQARVFDSVTGKARWEDGLGGIFEGRTTRFVGGGQEGGRDEGDGDGEGAGDEEGDKEKGETASEHHLSSSPTNSARSPPSAQALGMINASNRELVRRSARLLVHFGFDHLTMGKRSRTFPREWEQEAVRMIKEEEGGEDEEEDGQEGRKGQREVERLEVIPVGWDGKVIEDVTHQKGEWGLKWKDQKSRYTS